MKTPTPSNILITFIEGDSLEWPGLKVEELQYTGESAEFEQDAGMLEYSLANIADFQPPGPGTYYLYGFQATYYRSYEGEYDTDFALAGWRLASKEDEKEFFLPYSVSGYGDLSFVPREVVAEAAEKAEPLYQELGRQDTENRKV
jgi:hypothetical protein